MGFKVGQKYYDNLVEGILEVVEIDYKNDFIYFKYEVETSYFIREDGAAEFILSMREQGLEDGEYDLLKSW